eukprot:CAMPEP_0171983960 /NCGR_PEP_ID=MMETSP0993-20121228/273578_1 /TAXON_ID=483369 /ORGANISM="non described non described, Strain CCMP2098" /LENGTH=794 /DNA_ID=CAMNT_0012636759 /DNA_START=53 /DNA_END=2437 /DNA_ORIENTATION=-
MADSVEQLLERQIPALRDLVDRGIMTTEEVQGLVDQRRHFEYRLQRRSPRKVDFIRYIEYEGKVDALRKIRKQRLRLLKNTVSDFAQTQHVFFIFERACRKFQADPDMWLQYIDFAAKEKAEKRLGTLFPRALQLHPRHTGLWVKAASWQYFEVSNASAARVLLQRALRLNPHAELLWREYFRLELHYVAKLGQRRVVLGIDKSEGSDAKDAAFLQGAVPKAVYLNALKINPAWGLGFRVGFLRICNEFDETQHVVAAILDSIAQDFKGDPEGWVVRATYHLGGPGGEDKQGEEEESEAGTSDEKQPNKRRRVAGPSEAGGGAFSEGELASVSVLEQGVASLPADPNMWAAYARVLRSFDTAATPRKQAEVRRRLEGVYERAATCLTPELFLDWAKLEPGGDVVPAAAPAAAAAAEESEAGTSDEKQPNKRRRVAGPSEAGGDAFSEGELASVSVLEQGVASLPADPNMWAAYARVLRSFDTAATPRKQAEVRRRLEGVYERAATCLTPELFLDWAKLEPGGDVVPAAAPAAAAAARVGGVARSEAVLCRGLKAHPNSHELWTALVELKHWSHVVAAATVPAKAGDDAGSEDESGGAAVEAEASVAAAQKAELTGVVEEALAACSASLSSALVTALFQPLVSRFASHKLFAAALAHCGRCRGGGGGALLDIPTQLCCQYLRWASSSLEQGAVAGAAKVHRIVTQRFGRSTPALLPFFAEYINVLRLSQAASDAAIRDAFESAVSCAQGSSGGDDAESDLGAVFSAYADFELASTGDVAKAEAVRWRLAVAARSD